MNYICSIALTFVLTAGPVFAQFYQYTDKNGNVVITDSPPAGAAVREKKVEGEVYRSTGSEKDYPVYEKQDRPRSAKRKKEPREKNYNRVNVVMYMTDW